MMNVYRPLTGLRLLAGFAALILSQAISAQPHKMTYDIPAQSLESALTQFGMQSKRQLVFDPDTVPARTTPAVKGEYAPLEALDILIDNSGLTYSVDGKDTIIVRRIAAVSSTGSSTLRLAQPDSTENPKSPQKKDTQTSSNPSTEELEKLMAQEVVVTGTHIRGTTVVAAPTLTVTRDDFKKTGSASIQDIFARIPQSFNELSPNSASTTGSSRIATENTQGASSISLRGLGPEATLTLLNGQRRPGTVNGRVVDVSVIPLSVIDRIEVVEGGNSAIYGADAVAGVVNIITREEFDGAETELYFGAASDGGERVQASQVFGMQFERGGFVAAYDYTRQWALDLVDTDVIRAPSEAGFVPISVQNDADRWVHSGFLAGHFNISDSIELYGHGLYSSSKNRSVFAAEVPDEFDFEQRFNTDTDTFTLDLGSRIGLGDQWGLNVSGNYGQVDSAEPFLTGPVGGPFDQFGYSKNDSSQSAVTAVVDGRALSIGTVDIHAAAGAEWRHEKYESFDTGALRAQTGSRDVKSFFAEVNLPFIRETSTRTAQRFDVTVAGRYDDFSDFGHTFNPQYGALWKITDGFSLRGSYARTFRAPPLFTLGFEQDISIRNLNDPLSASGSSPSFYVTGGNPALKPEEADTYTFGFDFRPSFISGTEISVSYFNIRFDGRIDQPGERNDILPNSSVFTNIINRNPAEQQLRAISDQAFFFENRTGVAFDPDSQNFLDAFPGLVLIDNRRQNIASEKLDGLDLRLDSTVLTSLGEASFGINGTYYLKFERKVTPTADAISQINSPGKPADLRIRGYAGLARGEFGGFLYANYVDGYTDTLASTPRPIGSWTTFDLTLKYEAAEASAGALLSGLAISVSMDNVFDKDPPEFLSNDFGLGFDPANSNAYGRFISARITKRW